MMAVKTGPLQPTRPLAPRAQATLLVATMSNMPPLCSSMVSQRTPLRAVPACPHTW